MIPSLYKNLLSICHKTEDFVTGSAGGVCTGSGRGIKQTHLLQQNKVTHRQVRRGQVVKKTVALSVMGGREGEEEEEGGKGDFKVSETNWAEKSQMSRETVNRRQKEGIWCLSKQVAALRMTRVPARTGEGWAFSIWSVMRDGLKQTKSGRAEDETNN